MAGARPGPTRAQLAVQALLVLLLLGFYGLDLSDWFAARGAPVAALPAPPNLVVVALALLIVGAGIGALVKGLRAGEGPQWRGYRLFPIAAVVLLFFDFAVLSTTRSFGSSHDIALGVAEAVAARATGLSSPTHVQSDEGRLKDTLKDLPPVPFLLRGTQAPPWRIEVRRNCMGPSAEVRQAPVGTLIYCVDPTGSTAWVTVVGLPLDQRFGEAAVVTADPQVAPVAVPLGSELPPEDGLLEEPSDDVPPFHLPDANR